MMFTKISEFWCTMRSVDDFVTWLNRIIADKGGVRELARMMEVSSASVSNVRNGHTKPSLDFCLKLAKALKVQDMFVLQKAGVRWLPDTMPEVVKEIVQEVADWPEERQELLRDVARTLGKELRE